MRWFDLPYRLRLKIMSGYGWTLDGPDEFAALKQYVVNCQYSGEVPVWMSPNLALRPVPCSLPVGPWIVPGLQAGPATPGVRYLPKAVVEEMCHLYRIDLGLPMGKSREPSSWKLLERAIGADLVKSFKETP